MCQYRESNHLNPEHDCCYKNWDGPSSSMETDMLVEAFQRSQELHGLEYHTVVGDGDSSVFYNLKTRVSYGRSVKKVECANHAIKNYTKRLYVLRKESSILKTTFTPNIIKRLKTAARGAIIHNAENGNVLSLKEDLRNGPNHVFGDHSQCKPYFCTKNGEAMDLPKKFKQACEKSRFCLRPLLEKSSQIITNRTSNAAENYMALVAKFTGGKQVNRGKRGSFTYRTAAAGLDFQMGPSWHYKVMKTVLKKSPANIVRRTGENKEKRRASCRKTLFQSRNGRNLKNRMTYNARREKNKKGGCDYGEHAMKLDVEEMELDQMKKDKIKEMCLDKEEIARLEVETRGQAENERWHSERKDRLTASNFGLICKRRVTSKWAPVAKKNYLRPLSFKCNGVRI